MIGYALTLVLLFPMFWLIGAAANPGAGARRRARAGGRRRAGLRLRSVRGQAEGRMRPAARLFLEEGRRLYQGRRPGGRRDDRRRRASPTPARAGLDAALTAAGYDLDQGACRPRGNIAMILVAILVLSALSGMTYGPVAALLAEMFPPRIRYSSMSIPYHLGTGYFGGFLPFISQYIVAQDRRSLCRAVVHLGRACRWRWW